MTKEEVNELSNIQAIKRFFESGSAGRKITLPELKALSHDTREELAILCREALIQEV